MAVTNYPDGVSSEGVVVAAASGEITGTGSIETGLDSVTGAVCSLDVADIGVTAGDPAIAYCVAGTGGEVDVTVKQDDFATDATGAATVTVIAYGTKA